MALSAYCTGPDLHDHGLARGAITNPGRAVAAVYTSTDMIELDEHGFRDEAAIVFRVEDGGEMAAPLVAGTTYYVVESTDAAFQVSATAGGVALGLTTAGSDMIVSTALPKQEAIEWASGWLDEHLPAHVVPLEAPYPITAVAIVAQLAIAKLASYSGGSSATLAEAILFAQKQVDRWAKGIPIRGVNAPSPANLAVVASGTTVDARTGARGWSSRNSAGTDVIP
jgi:hypothetical protein